MRRLQLSVTLLFILCGSLFAQSDAFVPKSATHDDIVKWLQGGDPRMVAWGATFARDNKDDLATPYLKSLAVDWRETDKKSRFNLNICAMNAVLDAILAHRIALDEDVLHRLAPNFESQVGVALTFAEGKSLEHLLLSFYEGGRPNSGNTLQRVAAAMLALQPPRGFSMNLVQGTQIELYIRVKLPKDPRWKSASGFSDVMGRGTSPVLRNWPIVFGDRLYEHGTKLSDAKVLVPGRQSIWVVREELNGQYSGNLQSLLFEQRKNLVDQMLDVPSQAFRWQSSGEMTKNYLSDDQIRNSVRSIVRKYEAPVHASCLALAKKRLIGQEEIPKCYPAFRIRLSDERSYKTKPLPLISFPHSNVTWLP